MALSESGWWSMQHALVECTGGVSTLWEVWMDMEVHVGKGVAFRGTWQDQ